ncbi:MAG: aldehyde ferredoxin oxidoreductase C-terminal domain-containing protein [Myxococcota bacterium]|nr:aldehyde ferredoxin oxidoreductase C-terminal domain-containing protein [Myxococcota bacterium]
MEQRKDRILRVDMTSLTTTFEPYPQAWKLLGGRSLTARVLIEQCDPGCDALGAENVLVMAPGILSGTAVPTSGRISFGAKSPLTGGIKEANAGGEPGQHLMRLGIRAVVVVGQPSDSARRYALEVDSEGARIVAADEHAGRWNYELCEMLCERYAKTASFIVTGPAGELRLKGASIACTDRDDRIPSRHAARGGVGAVMGAKGLKYVAVDPGRAPVRKAADPQAFAKVVKRFTKDWQEQPNVFEHGTSAFVNVANLLVSLPTNNRRAGQAEYASQLDGSGIVESFEERGGRMHNCMTGCVVQCTNKVHDTGGNYMTSALEFETLALLGSNCGIQTWDDVAQLDRLCDEVGLDTIETGAAIGVYMDAGRMEYGDLSGMKKLFDEMAKGTEIGRTVGDGAASVGEHTGHDRVPVVKGQAIAAWEPRSLNATGVTYATSAMGADHTAGLSLDPAIPPDKLAETSQMLQMVNAANDSSGCCMFLGCCLDDLRDFYAGFYGCEVSRQEIGDMTWQILEDEWAFNRSAGFTAADDHLPAWMATEGLGPQEATFDVPDEILQAVYTRIEVGDALYTFKGSG